MEELVFPVSNYVGCMNSDQLKKSFPDLFPKIGDILIGEVQSEKEYGFFIKIAYQAHNYDCGLSGLLHRSNVNKSSPWSVANKNIGYDDYELIGRSVLVEVLSINEKGIGLKELDITNNFSAEHVMNSDDLQTIEMSRTITEVPINEGARCLKEIVSTDVLYSSKKNKSFIFKNDLYIRMYFAREWHYFTKDLTKSMTFENTAMCVKLYYHEDYRYYSKDKKYEKIWESNEDIIEYNREFMADYERSVARNAAKKEQEILENNLKRAGPIQTIELYKKSYYRESLSGRIHEDKYISQIYNDNEIKDFIEVFEDQNTNEIYIRQNNKFYKNNKYYENGDKYMLHGDEMLVVRKGTGRGHEEIIFYKYGVDSQVIANKYPGVATHLKPFC